MPTKLTIPMTKDFFDEVEDAFIDKPITAQKFIFGLVKGMCKDAKAGKLNKSCSINLIEPNGGVKQDFVKLKEINIDEYELVSNPAWLPKDLDKEDATNWEHTVTDKTMEYVILFCKFVGLRFQRYNESVVKIAEEKISTLTEELGKAPENAKPAIQLQIDGEQKALTEGQEKAKESVPKCIEECIYTQVYPRLHQEVMKNMDVEFDKEFEEIYPPPKKAEVKKESPHR